MHKELFYNTLAECYGMYSMDPYMMPIGIAKQLQRLHVHITLLGHILLTYMSTTKIGSLECLSAKLILLIHHEATKLISMIKQLCYDVPTLPETLVQQQLVVTNREHVYYSYVYYF
jgi:hypothetical protein